MKVYKTTQGIVIEQGEAFYLPGEQDWDGFINDDGLAGKIRRIVSSAAPAAQARALVEGELQAPIGGQELWASGGTYSKSKLGRQEESKQAGGGDFYDRVYSAARPELFFKATKDRTVGPGGQVRIRADSSWDVPEPELTLMITSSGKIVGYTIGNDMSSRSIEGENPLYLPQAKCYDGSAALGPCIYVTEDPLPPETTIALEIAREGATVFAEDIAISQIKRNFSELVSYLYRECSFPRGSLLMTGTGIVPTSEFTLHHGDEIRISISQIGTLINKVK